MKKRLTFYSNSLLSVLRSCDGRSCCVRRRASQTPAVKWKHHLQVSFESRFSHDGGYYKDLQKTISALLQDPHRQQWANFGKSLMYMFLGDRLIERYLRDYLIHCTGEYTGTGKLYHIAPVDQIDSILASGLRPKQRFVFLTDIPESYKSGFIPWKNAQIGKMVFALLEVDVYRLTRTQAIYCIDRTGEYVTGEIAPQYISVVSKKFAVF